MRVAALFLVVLVAGFGVAAAGCGGEEEASPTPDTVTGTITTEPEETEPEETETDTTETDTTETETETEPGGEGDPTAGKQIFISNCGTCHVLADAGTSGTIGPNLDESQPSVELVVDRVTNGQGAMPSFEDSLSEQQIADVAAYVSTSASG